VSRNLTTSTAATVAVSVPAGAAATRRADDGALPDLKQRTAKAALISSVCQVTSLALRAGSLMILSRLLTPTDFGLVGMVTAITGFMALFKDAGLSDAAVQQGSITHEQSSMLFWINAGIGCTLGLLCVVFASSVALFYGEPRLHPIMQAVGSSFVFTGLSTQHRALLLRGMRIHVIALTEVTALFTSILVAVTMAATGFGYWALVASTIILPAGTAIGVWQATRWVPDWPRRRSGTRSMIVYGGTVTLNSLVVYIAYNVEKVLLGRFWGAAPLGIYGRAYQLVNLPNDSLLSTLGSVAFPALCRVQDDPVRFRRYFLRMYGLFLSIAMPITVACALFSEDIVEILLGPSWGAVAPVFRLLTPTILSIALVNPFGWLLFANGRVARSLKIALLIAPVTILAYSLGLGSGPVGVATGFSTAMVILVVPIILWSKLNTLITGRDILGAVAHPVGSLAIAAVVALLARPWLAQIHWTLLRLSTASALLFLVYLLTLLFVFRQKDQYIDLLRQVGLWRTRRGGSDQSDQ
jgi:PST family polysaccharide transporter